MDIENRLPEHFGKITKLIESEEYGYVRSNINGQFYEFKASPLLGKFKTQENVAFLIRQFNGKEKATDIRRVYQNTYGIKFVPRVDESHIHRGIEPFLLIALDKIKDLKCEYIEVKHDFETTIGHSICVPTNEEDLIFYAKRRRRKGYSRFVLNREPIDTKFITLCLLKVITHYLIISNYFGLAAREPLDSRAIASDLEFWRNHALIYGYEEIEEGSRTFICPW